jgi:hypothetical protein
MTTASTCTNLQHAVACTYLHAAALRTRPLPQPTASSLVVASFFLQLP